jgi:hypothetical protein
MAQDALALALLDLTRDHDLAVANLDVDVLALCSRDLGLDDPGIVGFLEVHAGGPGAP